MQPVEELETARLIGERVRAEHRDELQRLDRDPEVMVTLGGVWSEEESERFLLRSLDHWERYGYGIWCFRGKTTGLFVGRAGLRRCELGGREEVELAYAFRPEAWGQGLTTEAARAILSVGFEHLGLETVVSFALPTNRASRRVMEKAGFEFEGDIVYADLPHVLYRIHAPSRCHNR